MRCKICGNDMKCIIKHGRDYFIGKGTGQFMIYYCKICKIGFTYPQMPANELNEYYPDSYEAYVPKRKILNLLQIYKYQSDIQIISKNLNRSPEKIFEIGSGRGQFLAILKKKWKNAVIKGTEQSLAGVKSAYKEYSIDLECKSADDIVFNEKYDLVIMRHVLEHLQQFDLVIQNIYQDGLKDNGLLFIKIPKLNSYEAKRFGKYWDGLDLPRHRVHFTETGIKKLLADRGFRYIKVYNEIVPSSFDRSMQYKKKGKEYLCDRWKFFRYLLISIGLLKHKKDAGRMIVIAVK